MGCLMGVWETPHTKLERVFIFPNLNVRWLFVGRTSPYLLIVPIEQRMTGVAPKEEVIIN
jgi:hypothetical protein